ncbi:phytanoyl-CoA dioxygenase family protein [Halopseudomonas xiamenensis]|uniref:phytanoyl-CoA dioxygenase family protein n=1 Tax=Halopseudomonas xiamenensis TaxID=157792 RepID=UPI0016253F2A|nr:phytanoyl-CoA dioxygenase family protein [Halopseudomonas xiamenensis]
MGNVAEIEATLDQVDSLHERFMRDGAVIIRNAFDEKAMQVIEQAYNYNFENPGPLAQDLYPQGGGRFMQCEEDSSQKPTFQAMFRETPIVDIAAGLFGSDDVWYFVDQLFYKEGDNRPVRRTPWHQDTPYLPIDGSKIAVFWIPMHDVDEAHALEVIRGSHRQTLFNGSFFAAEDDTLPLYDEKDMPRLPNIEAEREKWDIVTCPVKRGDVLIFHTSTLHGGGGTAPGSTRRSLSMRFVGDDVVRVERPEIKGSSPVTNNVGDEETKLQNRFTRIDFGEPIHKAGLTKLTRQSA